MIDQKLVSFNQRDLVYVISKAYSEEAFRCIHSITHEMSTAERETKWKIAVRLRPQQH